MLGVCQYAPPGQRKEAGDDDDGEICRGYGDISLSVSVYTYGKEIIVALNGRK